MTTAEVPRITRDDIETKLRQLKGDAEDLAGGVQKSNGIVIAAVGAVVLLALAYFLGRRKGKKRSAFVEIRRL